VTAQARCGKATLGPGGPADGRGVSFAPVADPLGCVPAVGAPPRARSPRPHAARSLRSLAGRPFLSVAAGLNYADRTGALVRHPAAARGSGATDAQIGWAGLLFLWSYALLSPFAGNLADKISRTRIIVWSLVVWSLITVGTGLVPGVMTLLVMRVALGVARVLSAGGGGPARRPPRSRHARQGHGSAYARVEPGGAARRFFCRTARGTFRLAARVLGARRRGLGLACFAPFYLRDGPVVVRTETAPAKPRPAQAWHYLLRTPSFHGMLLSAMVAGVASWTFLSWLPLFSLKLRPETWGGRPGGRCALQVAGSGRDGARAAGSRTTRPGAIPAAGSWSRRCPSW